VNLSADVKAAIEAQARSAANKGITPRDGCPWPFASREGRHWVAVWLLAGGKFHTGKGEPNDRKFET
jgi:hypothetical protein